MAKVTIIYETEDDPDGVEGCVIVSRDDVHNLQDLSRTYHDSTIAFGYDYTSQIVINTKNGKSFSSEW